MRKRPTNYKGRKKFEWYENYTFPPLLRKPESIVAVFNLVCTPKKLSIDTKMEFL